MTKQDKKLKTKYETSLRLRIAEVVEQAVAAVGFCDFSGLESAGGYVATLGRGRERRVIYSLIKHRLCLATLQLQVKGIKESFVCIRLEWKWVGLLRGSAGSGSVLLW